MSKIKLEKLGKVHDPNDVKEMRAAIEQMRKIIEQIEKELKKLDDKKQDK